ncbi:MAG: AAA family ATPase [Caldilineaceae bacterium]|nr:AAA family ATPase [Caldilineaceae bacterium]
MVDQRQAQFPTLFTDLWEALKQWQGNAQGESPLRYLYLFRQLERQGQDNARRVTNQLLTNIIEQLRQTNESDANLLQLRFLDLWPMHRLAHHFNVAESTAFTMQRDAIVRLADTVVQLELQASAAQKALLKERLEPASYLKLIGVAEQITQLLPVITAAEPPWLIALEGMGGIGKTSLADALLRQLIDHHHYDEVGWVSARQYNLNLGGVLYAVHQPALTAEALVEKLAKQLMPDFVAAAGNSAEKVLRQLQARLKAIPHLVVIDNLETLTDVESLLPTLQTLSNPSKFLLTSRASLRTTPNIYHVTVPELNEPNALRLIRQEADLSNLPVLAASTDADLLPIVAAVGGNPLALRLVVGQTHLYTLESILADLQGARGTTVQNLYTFIYRRIWDKLEEISRLVLLVMPLVKPGGETLEYIADVGKMEVGQVRMALNQLIQLNLVDARGGLHDRRYSIHGLTRTFLQEQVAQWWGGGHEDEGESDATHPVDAPGEL